MINKGTEKGNRGHRYKTCLQEAADLFSHAESHFLTLRDGAIEEQWASVHPEPSVERGRCLMSVFRLSSRGSLWRSNKLQRNCVAWFGFAGTTQVNWEHYWLIDWLSSLFAVKRFREPVGIRRPWRIWSDLILSFPSFDTFLFSTISHPVFLHFTPLHRWTSNNGGQTNLSLVLVKCVTFPSNS